MHQANRWVKKQFEHRTWTICTKTPFAIWLIWRNKNEIISEQNLINSPKFTLSYTTGISGCCSWTFLASSSSDTTTVTKLLNAIIIESKVKKMIVYFLQRNPGGRSIWIIVCFDDRPMKVENKTEFRNFKLAISESI